MSRSRVSTAAHMQRWLDMLNSQQPETFAQLGRGVVVGLSGGADSLSLVHAATRAGLNVEAVVVDHQLQAGSRAVAERAARQAEGLGASARIVPVEVEAFGEGPARAARYRALGAAAEGRGVLIAHTATDDAEGFLLGLARGSGTESLAGMREFTREHPAVEAGAGWVGRPLLHASREDTVATCEYAALDYWTDPHNSSPDYLRSRIRTELLPHMQEVLGGAVVDHLALSARLLRDDATTLDSLAQSALQEVSEDADAEGLASKINCLKVSAHQPAMRRRIYRAWLKEPAGALTNVHIEAIDALVIAWRGQGPVSVPWSAHWHTMNPARRATHRLVVRRQEKHLVLHALPRAEHPVPPEPQ